MQKQIWKESTAIAGDALAGGTDLPGDALAGAEKAVVKKLVWRAIDNHEQLIDKVHSQALRNW